MPEPSPNPKRCTVTFLPMNVKVTVSAGEARSPVGPAGTILNIALGSGVAIPHACGGVGACSTCHVIIKEGMGNLSPPDDEELDRVEQAPGNTVSSRLACRAEVRGDVVVVVPQWNRNLVQEADE